MNIDELIHDLRARINPQYFDQPGNGGRMSGIRW